jgi:hypothetical protein
VTDKEDGRSEGVNISNVFHTDGIEKNLNIERMLVISY